jgi:hypothetical protein
MISMLKVLAWLAPLPLFAAQPFRIEVVDKDNGWPVPLVELRTTHDVRHVTDNLGLVALDEPELMNHEIWLSVKGQGYGVAKDNFGYEGIRTTPVPGGKLRIEVERRIVAKRLGRLTGAGLFAEAEKLGERVPDVEYGVYGCDSVLTTSYGNHLFWLWGDTTVPKYPLGIFSSTAATTDLKPFSKFQPPIAPPYVHFRDKEKSIRGVADISGDGPTWLGGMISLKDARGAEHLVATYSKIRSYVAEYECGLCEWDPATSHFKRVKVIWKDSDGKKPPMPYGHPIVWTEGPGSSWMLCGDPFPTLKFRPTYEAWADPSSWQAVDAPSPPLSAKDRAPVPPHRGSVVWNAFRKRWIAIYTQKDGKPSAVGEIWYAEATSPLGPWGPAVKVLSHDNYTFYNPIIHAEMTPADASFIVFEGTFTAEFADHAQPVPRYNYNQILYRLDLDDPKLADALKQ